MMLSEKTGKVLRLVYEVYVVVLLSKCTTPLYQVFKSDLCKYFCKLVKQFPDLTAFKVAFHPK